MGNLPPKLDLARALRSQDDAKVTKHLGVTSAYHYTLSDLRPAARALLTEPSMPLAPPTSRRYRAWSQTTLLHCACEGANRLVVPILLTIPGVDLRVQSLKNGDTPVHSLCGSRGGAVARLEVLKTLLVALDLGGPGARTNALTLANNDGDTPLHVAARHGDPRIVEELLRQGAAPATSNKDGLSPAGVADEARHSDVGTLIEAQVVYPNDLEVGGVVLLRDMSRENKKTGLSLHDIRTEKDFILVRAHVEWGVTLHAADGLLRHHQWDIAAAAAAYQRDPLVACAQANVPGDGRPGRPDGSFGMEGRSSRLGDRLDQIRNTIAYMTSIDS